MNLQILETRNNIIIRRKSWIDGICKIKESKFKNSMVKWKIVLFHLSRSALLILSFPTSTRLGRTGMINDSSSIPSNLDSTCHRNFFHCSTDFMDLYYIIFIIVIIFFIDRKIYFWNRWGEKIRGLFRNTYRKFNPIFKKESLHFRIFDIWKFIPNDL